MSKIKSYLGKKSPYLNKKFEEIKLRKLMKKQNNAIGEEDRAIAFDLCPSDYTPIKKGRDAGKLSLFNDDLYAIGILIAVQDKYNPIQKGISRHYNLSTINNVVNHALTCGSAVLLSHNEVKIRSEKQVTMLKKQKKKNEMVKYQVQTGTANVSNAMINENSEKNNKNHINIAIDGDDYYSWVCVPCAVFSQDLDRLKGDISKIETALIKGGIRYIIPKFNQKAVIQAAIPFSSQVDIKFLQRVNGRTVTSLLPFRNPYGSQPKEGFIFAVNAITGRPMKIYPTVESPEHTLIVAPTGSGKTVQVCNIAGNAIALGYDVKIIEPKNEDADGSDYLNFCKEYGGGVSRWGADEGCVSPDPLIIYYNEAKMGTDPASYRKAKDEHFYTVQNMYRAWKGGLNERQSGMITSTLIKLYIERQIIDEDGNPKNTHLWTKPGALDWPSIHEHRMYMRKEYKDKNSEYYKDPSLKAFLDSTMNAEPAGTLWWWANSKQFFDIGSSNGEGSLQLFDISQVPENMRSVIAIHIMGVCNTLYYPKKNDGKPRQRTLLIFDEIKNLCSTPELIPYMERVLNEGRAPGLTWIGATQKPLPDREFMDTIKANCRNLIVLCNLKPQNIDMYMDAFKIPTTYRSKLLRVGKGIGIYFRDLLGTEIIVELDDMLKNSVLKSKRGLCVDGTCAPAHGIEVQDFYKGIFEKEEMFLTAWLNSKEQGDYPGYKNYTPNDPIGYGSLSAYVRKTKITEHEELTKEGKKMQDIIDNEGEVHFVCVCRIAGWMMRHGYPNVRINHVELPDITWGDVDEQGGYIKNDRFGCLEYEGKGTHDKSNWNDKLKRAREHGYKNMIFTGHSTTCKGMKTEESHVKELVYPQGETHLLRKLEELADVYKICSVGNPNTNSACVEAMEA